MENRNITVGSVAGQNITLGDGSRAGDDHYYSAPEHRDKPSSNPADKARQVFVIHGRDEQARNVVFDVIRSLGLTPMEWEHLVRETRSGAPSLSKVVSDAPKFAQAVVALLTPDDIVELHPSLREAGDENAKACQARPNVFIEIGMALALLPTQTIMLKAGVMRWPADLDGLNYIRITDSPEWCNKLATRLVTAGCPVNRDGNDWQHTSQFRYLDAYGRNAHASAPQ
jgi:predicted nucleotide-binding protein